MLLVFPGKGRHQHSSSRFTVRTAQCLRSPPSPQSDRSTPSLSPSPEEENPRRPSNTSEKRIWGYAAAMSRTKEDTLLASEAADFRNFLLAGRVQKRSSTESLVPCAQGVGT